MADKKGKNGERTEFKVVGKPNLPGRLAYVMATGRAKYGSDVVVPGMLHAKFLRNPYGNARIKKINIEKAKKLPGVADILTWEDPDIKKINTMGAIMMFGMPGMGMFGMTGGPGMEMLQREADMEGEEIGVIVVAESEEICDRALDMIGIDWEILPHVLDPREGIKPGAPVIRKNFSGKGNAQTPMTRSSGFVSSGFKEADHIIEFDYNLPAFASHIPVPTGGVAWWEEDRTGSREKGLFIEGICSASEEMQLENMYGISKQKIFQHTVFMGGRYCDWGVRRTQLITPLLAKRTGKPVRAVNARRDMYDAAIIPRYAHEKIGFTNDGVITAAEDYIIVDAGVRGSSNFGTTMDIMWNPFFTTKCRNLKSTANPVNTNTSRMYVSGQHWPYNWDVLTIAEQMIADKLDMDPIDVALKNIHGPKSQNDETIPESFRLCIEKGKKAIKWNWHKPGAKKLEDGRMHGLSFRYQMCPRHAQMTYSCTVILKNDGKVYVPTKGPWFGNYNTDAVAMVVAEEMGAKYEDVILEFDPKAIFTPMGGGSDGTTASSWVAKEAAFKCRSEFLKSAASHPELRKLKVKWKDLDTGGSRVFVKSNPEISFSFSEIAPKTEIMSSSSGRPPVGTWNTGMGKILETMNATFCEVAVDTETGQVEVLQYVIAVDPGKIIRPTSIIGQLNQVMMFTSGSNISEDIVFDKKTGVKLNTNMIDYKKPTILDTAPVEPILFETRSGNACYGGAGISHSMASTHLVVCAVANAIGKWIDPPMTPDRVLKALGKA